MDCNKSGATGFWREQHKAGPGQVSVQMLMAQLDPGVISGSSNYGQLQLGLHGMAFMW